MIIDNNFFLAKTIKKLRAKKKIIGLIHGVFDLIHAGHILHIKSALKQCDELIVSITADQFVNKGPNRPVLNQIQRANLILNIKGINFVFINNYETSENVIQTAKPDLYFKGKDYKNQKDLTENLKKEIKCLKKNNGKIIYTSDKIFSSTKILKDKFNLKDTNIENIKNKKIDYKKLMTISSKIISKKIPKKILVLGEPIIDQYKYVKTLGKSAKNNILTTSESESIKLSTYYGGSLLILNVLEKFIDNVEVFDLFKNTNITKKNLNNSLKIQNNLKEKLIIKQRFIDEYSSQKLFQINFNQKINLEKLIEKKIIKFLRKNYKNYDLIVIADFGHGLINDNILKCINSIKANYAINCQVNSYNYGFNLVTKYKKGYLVSIDEVEFRLAFKDQHGAIEKIIINNLSLIKNYKYFVVTLGKKGSILVHKSKIYQFPTITKNNVDTTGCGDIFFSFLIISKLLENLNIDECLFIATLFAGEHSKLLGNSSKNYNPKILHRLLQYFA
jgi:cytidyltransferase-like protein